MVLKWVPILLFLYSSHDPSMKSTLLISGQPYIERAINFGWFEFSISEGKVAFMFSKHVCICDSSKVEILSVFWKLFITLQGISLVT